MPVCAVALATPLMAIRLMMPPALGEQRLIPVACILAALVFLWLYDRWLDQEVSGAQVADAAEAESGRLQRVDTISRWQAGLVIGYAVLGHLLLSINWVHDPDWIRGAGMAGALAGGLLGVIGCARALTSDLHARRYRQVV